MKLEEPRKLEESIDTIKKGIAFMQRRTEIQEQAIKTLQQQMQQVQQVQQLQISHRKPSSSNNPMALPVAQDSPLFAEPTSSSSTPSDVPDTDKQLAADGALKK